MSSDIHTVFALPKQRQFFERLAYVFECLFLFPVVRKMKKADAIFLLHPCTKNVTNCLANIQKLLETSASVKFAVYKVSIGNLKTAACKTWAKRIAARRFFRKVKKRYPCHLLSRMWQQIPNTHIQYISPKSVKKSIVRKFWYKREIIYTFNVQKEHICSKLRWKSNVSRCRL